MEHTAAAAPPCTLSASIVVYNGFEAAAACIESVLQATQKVPLQLYVVDNASPDGSGKKLQQRFAGRATVLCSEKNLGYGAGHNLCLPLVQSRYHAVINPDIALPQDVLSALCDYLEGHPDVAMVTPQLRFPDGRVQQVAKRTPNLLALAARQLGWRWLAPYEAHYLMLDADLTREQDIQFCTGCFFVARTQALRQVGGFDEKYFMYVEDADLTRKMAAVGRAVYLPEVFVYHDWHRAPHSSLRPFLRQLHSMLRYFAKWGFCLGVGRRAAPLPTREEE